MQNDLFTVAAFLHRCENVPVLGTIARLRCCLTESFLTWKGIQSISLDQSLQTDPTEGTMACVSGIS